MAFVFTRLARGGVAIALLTASLAACTQYKPTSLRRQIGNTDPATSGNVNSATAPLTDASLVLANTKLAALGGPLTARITFGGATINQDFTPSGTQTELKGLRIPGASGVMTVEILQGDAVRFIAKRAKTSIQAGSRVVIDDCLILRAPWAGTVNEGSCEWNITEVTN